MSKFIEVYKDFPWVRNFKFDTNFTQIDDVGVFYFDIKYSIRHDVDGHYNKSYINPKAICSVDNGTIMDDMEMVYPYCDILMISGEHYYLPRHWMFGKDDE